MPQYTPGREIANWLIYLVSISGIGLFGPATVLACSCADKPSLEQSYDQSSAVFLGKVQSIAASRLRTDQNEVKVLVIKVFKDDVGLSPKASALPDEAATSTAIVFTSQQESLCGYPFAVGQDYIIFARGNLARISVSLCSRTVLLDGATAEMAELEKIAANLQKTPSSPAESTPDLSSGGVLGAASSASTTN